MKTLTMDRHQDEVIEALAAQMSVEAFDRSLNRLIALGLVIERKGATPDLPSSFCPFAIAPVEVA